jgi:hypothetical protein
VLDSAAQTKAHAMATGATGRGCWLVDSGAFIVAADEDKELNGVFMSVLLI